MAGDFHTPVMAREVLALLVTDTAGTYIDCTVGGGGHLRQILDAAPDAKLIGLDRDHDAIEAARRSLPSSLLLQIPFSRLAEVRASVPHGAHGILFDLGLSSFQIDQAERGFSFLRDGPLDMRMGVACDRSAADIVDESSETDLAGIFYRFGEEPQSRRIARAIVRERAAGRIGTTAQLARIVSRAVPAAGVKSLARVFQALRIAVNGELEEITVAMPVAFDLLRSGGRLVILSYHSLEDRLVKEFMRSKTQHPETDKRFPVSQTALRARLLTKKPLTSGPEEIAANSRARTAKLRALERI